MNPDAFDYKSPFERLQASTKLNGSLLQHRFANPLNPLKGRHITGVKYSQNWVFLMAVGSQKDRLA